MAFTLSAPAHSDLTIKKSRFIGCVQPMPDRASAQAHVDALWQQHPGAAHICWALLAGGQSAAVDDGEPGGTAGRPMLDVLRHHDLEGVQATVVRYFGGVKLGAGGLVRAYTAAASGALQSAELVSMRLVVDCKVRVSYAQFEQAQRIIAAAETRLDEPIFDDAVTLCWRMPAGQEETLRTALNELTRGGAEVEISAPQYAAF